MNAVADIAGFPISRVPVVNVATIPQRSPLRYPGGKTWLIPHIREWLSHTKAKLLIEPFAGGGIVTLTAIAEGLVKEAVMLEIDRDVAAFWRGAFESGATLAEWVRQFSPTLESLNELLDEPPGSLEEHAFRTLVLNRTRRGGILAPGASFSRQGENGKGLLSRWYPNTLAERLLALQHYRDQITFLEGDGLKLLPTLLRGWGRYAAVFLDPPYTSAGGKRAGSRLYAHSDIDHKELFALLAKYKPCFLMTYDSSPEIIRLVRKYNFDAVLVYMKNTHHNQTPELIISSTPLFSGFGTKLLNGLASHLGRLPRFKGAFLHDTLGNKRQRRPAHFSPGTLLAERKAAYVRSDPEIAIPLLHARIALGRGIGSHYGSLILRASKTYMWHTKFRSCGRR